VFRFSFKKTSDVDPLVQHARGESSKPISVQKKQETRIDRVHREVTEHRKPFAVYSAGKGWRVFHPEVSGLGQAADDIVNRGTDIGQVPTSQRGALVTRHQALHAELLRDTANMQRHILEPHIYSHIPGLAELCPEGMAAFIPSPNAAETNRRNQGAPTRIASAVHEVSLERLRSLVSPQEQAAPSAEAPSSTEPQVDYSNICECGAPITIKSGRKTINTHDPLPEGAQGQKVAEKFKETHGFDKPAHGQALPISERTKRAADCLWHPAPTTDEQGNTLTDEQREARRNNRGITVVEPRGDYFRHFELVEPTGADWKSRGHTDSSLTSLNAVKGCPTCGSTGRTGFARENSVPHLQCSPGHINMRYDKDRRLFVPESVGLGGGKLGLPEGEQGRPCTAGCSDGWVTTQGDRMNENGTKVKCVHCGGSGQEPSERSCSCRNGRQMLTPSTDCPTCAGRGTVPVEPPAEGENLGRLETVTHTGHGSPVQNVACTHATEPVQFRPREDAHPNCTACHGTGEDAEGNPCKNCLSTSSGVELVMPAGVSLGSSIPIKTLQKSDLATPQKVLWIPSAGYTGSSDSGPVGPREQLAERDRRGGGRSVQVGNLVPGIEADPEHLSRVRAAAESTHPSSANTARVREHMNVMSERGDLDVPTPVGPNPYATSDREHGTLHPDVVKAIPDVESRIGALFPNRGGSVGEFASRLDRLYKHLSNARDAEDRGDLAEAARHHNFYKSDLGRAAEEGGYQKGSLLDYSQRVFHPTQQRAYQTTQNRNIPGRLEEKWPAGPPVDPTEGIKSILTRLNPKAASRRFNPRMAVTRDELRDLLNTTPGMSVFHPEDLDEEGQEKPIEPEVKSTRVLRPGHPDYEKIRAKMAPDPSGAKSREAKDKIRGLWSSISRVDRIENPCPCTQDGSKEPEEFCPNCAGSGANRNAPDPRAQAIKTRNGRRNYHEKLDWRGRLKHCNANMCDESCPVNNLGLTQSSMGRQGKDGKLDMTKPGFIDRIRDSVMDLYDQRKRDKGPRVSDTHNRGGQSDLTPEVTSRPPKPLALGLARHQLSSVGSDGTIQPGTHVHVLTQGFLGTDPGLTTDPHATGVTIDRYDNGVHLVHVTFTPADVRRQAEKEGRPFLGEGRSRLMLVGEKNLVPVSDSGLKSSLYMGSRTVKDFPISRIPNYDPYEEVEPRESRRARGVDEESVPNDETPEDKERTTTVVHHDYRPNPYDEEGFRAKQEGDSLPAQALRAVAEHIDRKAGVHEGGKNEQEGAAFRLSKPRGMLDAEPTRGAANVKQISSQYRDQALGMKDENELETVAEEPSLEDVGLHNTSFDEMHKKIQEGLGRKPTLEEGQHIAESLLGKNGPAENLGAIIPRIQDGSWRTHGTTARRRFSSKRAFMEQLDGSIIKSPIDPSNNKDLEIPPCRLCDQPNNAAGLGPIIQDKKAVNGMPLWAHEKCAQDADVDPFQNLMDFRQTSLPHLEVNMETDSVTANKIEDTEVVQKTQHMPHRMHNPVQPASIIRTQADNVDESGTAEVPGSTFHN